MKWLTEIELLKGRNNLEAGYKISNLIDVNLLVGDQGVGKSTLLDMLGNNDKDLQVVLSDEAKKNGVKTYFFDSEKDNPRTKDLQMYTNINGTPRGIGLGRAASYRWRSHGECLIDFTIRGIEKAENCIIIFDEPESGLSIRNQFKLAEAFEQAIKRNCQVFVATHCFPLIEAQEIVYSMEHNEWMSSKDFIKTQEI